MTQHTGYREEVELAAHSLKEHHAQIKWFVKRYGQRASLLLSLAAKACSGNSSAHEELLKAAVSAKEVDEALELALALGPAAAPVVPEIVTAYYGGWNVNVFA